MKLQKSDLNHIVGNFKNSQKNMDSKTKYLCVFIKYITYTTMYRVVFSVLSTSLCEFQNFFNFLLFIYWIYFTQKNSKFFVSIFLDG